MIIGISGKIGSGKDTVGMIMSQMLGYKIKKFATSLKEICSILLNCNPEWFEDREFKKTSLEDWNGDTGRQFMINLSAKIREQYPNAFVTSLFKDYDSKKEDWIITDLRFPEEFKRIKERGGVCIRINRGTNPHAQVKGETEDSLDNYSFDYTIENDGDLDDLADKVYKLVEEI